MIATGSVRGKCSVLHAGHSRFQPACDMFVGAPQLAQKRCRACQASSAFASASGARWSGPTSPCTAIERRSVTNRSGRSLSALVASGSSAMPKRPASPTRPRNTFSAVGASARASSGRNSGSAPFAAFLHHHQFAADRDRCRRARRPRRRQETPHRCGARRRAPECWRYSQAAASARDRGEVAWKSSGRGRRQTGMRARPRQRGRRSSNRPVAAGNFGDRNDPR